MKQEQLLDALAAVDAELLEEVNARRQQKRPRRWGRWVALAACLCLAVGIILWRAPLEQRDPPGITLSEDGVTILDTAQSTPILEVADEMTQVVGKFTDATLGELWLHEVLDDNPYADLTDIAAAAELEGYTNLNVLNVSGVIDFIKALTSSDLTQGGGTDAGE